MSTVVKHSCLLISWQNCDPIRTHTYVVKRWRPCGAVPTVLHKPSRNGGQTQGPFACAVTVILNRSPDFH